MNSITANVCFVAYSGFYSSNWHSYCKIFNNLPCRQILANPKMACVFSKLCSTSRKNISKLQTVQNFAARILTGTRKYDHITPVLEQLKWLPVEKSLYLRDCVMAHKCLNNSLPDYLYQTFITRSEISNCVTRQSSQLHKPLCRTSTAQKSFLYRASTLWNDLHESFKSKFFKTLLCVWIS